MCYCDIYIHFILYFIGKEDYINDIARKYSCHEKTNDNGRGYVIMREGVYLAHDSKYQYRKIKKQELKTLDEQMQIRIATW